jgi:hypothetical protein
MQASVTKHIILKNCIQAHSKKMAVFTTYSVLLDVKGHRPTDNYA